MGDAAGQLPKRFHFLRMTQLLFQHSACRDVLGDDLDSVISAFRTGYPAAAGPHNYGFAVLALPGKLHGIEEVCAGRLSPKAACIPFGIEITGHGERKNLRL